MSELNQQEIDKVAGDLQSGVQAVADAAQAVDQAAATAQEIAGEISGSPAPASIPEPGMDTAQMAATDGPAAALESHASTAPETRPVSKEVQRLLAIEVPIIVQLGIRRLTVAEVMRFAVGAIIEFSKSAEEEMELLANNMTIGKGQAVKVGENFGIKISTIGSVKEMIKKLGGA